MESRMRFNEGLRAGLQAVVQVGPLDNGDKLKLPAGIKIHGPIYTDFLMTPRYHPGTR